MRLRTEVAALKDTKDQLTKKVTELKETNKVLQVTKDERDETAKSLNAVVEQVNVFTSTGTDLAPPAERQVRATAEYLRLREKTRPILAGSSIGRKGMAISACCVVWNRKGERFLLTLKSDASVGDRVLQPAPADGPGSPIGTIVRVGARENRSGALVRLEPDIEMDQTIPNFGPIRGVARVAAENELRAVGRGSGFTTGHVLVVRRGDIMTTVAFAPGDEGAPVVNADNQLVGLLYAGHDRISYVAPIGPLLRELDVTLEKRE
jgi:hypothetical protein